MASINHSCIRIAASKPRLGSRAVAILSRAPPLQQHRSISKAGRSQRLNRSASTPLHASASATPLDAPSTSSSSSSSSSTRQPDTKRRRIPNHLTWLSLGEVDGPASPFHVLGLTDQERNALGNIRSRNYSNLSKPQHQVPAQPLQPWGEVFADPSLPLVVDVGCGSGRFVLLLAHQKRSQGIACNCLGLDIHTVMIKRANQWASKRSLQSRLHYMVANAAISLPSLLESYPGPVELVCVQYHDPHVRRQRHVVHPDFVRGVAALLGPGGHMYLASDIETTAVHMRDTFERYGSDAFGLDDLHHTPGATFLSAPSLSLDPRPTLSEARSSGSDTDGSDSSQFISRTAPFAVTSDQEANLRSPTPEPSMSSSSQDSTSSGAQSQSGPREALYTGGVSQRALQALAASPPSPRAPADVPSPAEDREVEGDSQGDAWVSSWAERGWLVHNPVGAPTEREVFMDLVMGEPVFRVYLRRV